MLQTDVKTPRAGWLPFQGAAAFPAILCVSQTLHLAGHMAPESGRLLEGIARRMDEAAHLRRVLEAPSATEMDQALRAAGDAFRDSYLDCAVTLWRALDHRPDRLLQLAGSTAQAIEAAFQNGHRLKRETLIQTLAAFRTATKVGEWTVKTGERAPETRDNLLLDIVPELLEATLITFCLLLFATGDVGQARSLNPRRLANRMAQAATAAYDLALARKLPEVVGEANAWYWSVRRQEGEVEADLDIREGRLRRAAGVEDLVRDLQ